MSAEQLRFVLHHHKSSENEARRSRRSNLAVLQEEPATPPRIIMNLMREWVKYFNINLSVPTYAHTHTQHAALGSGSLWNVCIFLFTPLPTPLFALLIWLHPPHRSATPPPTPPHPPQPLQQCNRVTCPALFIIVYLERTCFIRQAVSLCPIDPRVSVSWMMVRGEGEGAGEVAAALRPRQTPRLPPALIDVQCRK